MKDMRKTYICPKSEVVRLQLQSDIVDGEYIPITLSHDTDEQLSKRFVVFDVEEEEEDDFKFLKQNDNALTLKRFKSLWDE